MGETCQQFKCKGGTHQRTFFEATAISESWWNFGETLVEPWSNVPRNFLATQDGSAPENQKHHDTLVETCRNLGGSLLPSAEGTRDTTKLGAEQWNHGETLVEPWWNLLRNLLAAQDGRAPLGGTLA